MTVQCKQYEEKRGQAIGRSHPRSMMLPIPTPAGFLPTACKLPADYMPDKWTILAGTILFQSPSRPFSDLTLMSKHKGVVKKRSSWKGRERRPDDTVMLHPRDTDIVIPLIGSTGAGKSTFINTAVGTTKLEVGHSMTSQAAKVQHVIVEHPREPNRRIVLLDTPGFNDTSVEDSEILRRISVWLATSYSDGMKLGGVIYLYDVTQRSVSRSTRQNMEMFHKLCGNDAMKNVVLATTMWDEVSEEVGARREKQLSETYWKEMQALGAKMRRFKGTRESAWDLITVILDNIATSSKSDIVDSVQIQDEMVELQKALPYTEAGQVLCQTLKEWQEVRKATIQQAGVEKGRSQKRIEEIENKIRSVLLQIRALGVPLPKRIASYFGLA